MQSDVHGPGSGQAAAQTARMSNDARFPPDTYGMLSRHGMRPGMDGPVNKINQDRAALCQHPHDSSVVVAAVFANETVAFDSRMAGERRKLVRKECSR